MNKKMITALVFGAVAYMFYQKLMKTKTVYVDTFEKPVPEVLSPDVAEEMFADDRMYA